ncbi:unnamed protein product, partial [Didymodactylos carnosus]
MATHLEA